MKKKIVIFLAIFAIAFVSAQTITEVTYNVSSGTTTFYDTPGIILYPTGYAKTSAKTPVIFVHGITGKLSGSYDANIDEVQSYGLYAAFVQLEPLGSTIENGKLLKKMIDKVRHHFGTETVSIVAHSKGGLDTERALYGQNPYVNYSLPSFGYEKVDGVYTFSSPVQGARVADLGSTLSYFSGLAWATMWYTNGNSLTSGTVNSFHNWAKNWRINSTSTFKNYYHPNGASYSRLNLVEDNTTRWWAHQSDDECYQNIWYYCYVGKAFQHSVGAYLDAYWEWDWFDSGWRNWHSNSDGFISEYRAKRNINGNAYPSLTPGSGDSNYRTMHDANHSSLWEQDENHFSREVAPYLHIGLFNGYNYGRASITNITRVEKNKVKAKKSKILASNGNIYFGENGTVKFIVEENNKPLDLLIYAKNTVGYLNFINDKTGKKVVVKTLESRKDMMSGANITVANVSGLKNGTYSLLIDENNFLVIANSKETNTAFAVNLNFDEEKGYNGERIEVGIANKDNKIDFDAVSVIATLSRVGIDQDTPIAMDKVQEKIFQFKPLAKKGKYGISFENLIAGSVYSLRVEATSKAGEVLLSRNVVHTFYVKKEMREQTVSVIENTQEKPSFNEKTLVEVYPNPTSRVINIIGVINQVELLNDRGEIINNFTVLNNKLSLDVKKIGLKKGFYILRIKSNNSTEIRKIMVK